MDQTTPSLNTITYERWRKLDDQIRLWWDGDIHTAQEEDIRRDEARTLTFLPHPYSSAGGSEAIFPEMYAWDTYFINLALLEHGRRELVYQHILNYLFMIERYGFMPNGNRTFYITRSQTPVFPDSIWQYYLETQDRDILHRSYPVLKKEYLHYWLADHHQTPTGLATNYDLGDPGIPKNLAAEAETGLDFSNIFEADVNQCTPLITNSVLVQYAKTLAAIANELGESAEAVQWLEQAEQRGRIMRELCWNEREGFFFEYNYKQQKQLPYWSLSAYWTLWAGVATDEQAQKLVEHLERFEQTYGYSVTDQAYPSPHSQFSWVQWSYPAGWAPLHIMLTVGLDKYGYKKEAERVAQRFLSLLITVFEQTGNLYEKYNVVDGNAHLPFERMHETPTLHGWTSAAGVLLGRRLFHS